jgi:hypothetical protein
MLVAIVRFAAKNEAAGGGRYAVAMSGGERTIE